ncbi:MAG: hypothetical protein ACTHK8_02820 [Ginsengibacter sp.]
MPPSFETVDDGVNFFSDILSLGEVAHAALLSETEMLAPLLSGFFEKKLIHPGDIELLVLIGDELNKGTRMPNLAHYIQHTHGLKKADVLHLSGNHCSNVEYAISYSESLLKSQEVNNVLIVAVNKLARLEERVIGNYAVQGDAAALVYLNRDLTNGVMVHGKNSYTNGLLYEADVNKASALLLCKNYIYCMSGLIKKFNILPRTVKGIIIQNANHLLVTQCLNNLGFSNDQVFMENINTFGHLDCIDFLVNLQALLRGGKEGDKLISFGSGWAGSYIALYLEIV